MNALKVIFYPVKTQQAKLEKLVQVATLHFEKKEPLLFLVPSEEVALFLDQLFWKMPKEGFLPHPSHLLHISDKVLPEFPCVFNLCKDPLFHPLKAVYELEDLTHPEKQALSKKRYDLYKNHGYQVIMDTSNS
ncbi:DNA polymerase III subunit chi [Rhabdochlamydiaceae symbiont of Dictyostelium giganteum]|uniref:DNA polymerase III subunit chi n=1 Tax=Rhabdochlamydiaceae symbiont of Dictyostelium giganteum TaxID=3342349 RepID=UPI00384F03C1